MFRILLSTHLFFGVLVVVPSCPSEISSSNYTDCNPISQEVNGKLLWWGNYTDENEDEDEGEDEDVDDFGLYISEPLCLSEKYKIIKRKCINGTWSEEPSCIAIQRVLSPCPEDFTYQRDYEICYVIVANQTFPPTCPYKNTVSFYDYASLIGYEITGPVWFPATRSNSDSYGIGQLTLIEPTRYYGSVVTVTYSWKNSFYKNCLISHSENNYEVVFCNSTYDAVCAYKPLGFLKNTYCKTNIDDQCYYSNYNLSESKCFCMQNDTQHCEALAELKKPYQNFILPTNRSECRIGLELDGNFLWANSREKISYSNWNRRTDFSNKYGVLTKESSWSLEDENDTIRCIICEESTTFNRAKLSLAVDTKNKELILTVDNPKDLYVPEGSDNFFFCFTDTTNTTESSVQYSHVTYDSYEIINTTRIQYHFLYSSNFPGHYWCKAFTHPELDVIETEKVLVFDEDIYGNEFATTFMVEYNSSVDPRTFSFYKLIFESIYDHILNENGTFPFHIRLLTISTINENDFTIEYLIHVTSKCLCDLQSEYNDFSALIATSVSKVSAILYMTDFRSVTYCLANSTVSNGITLQWPLTKINSTITPEEFCLQEDGLPVTRTCGGNFLTGAKWSEVIGSCADNPVQSTLTSKLYELVHTNASLTSKSNMLAELTKDVHEYIPVDIHYIAEIFDKSDKEEVTNIQNVTAVIDNIIDSDKSAMKLSQRILNSTDRILYNYDILLQKFIKRQTKKTSDSLEEIVTKNLLVLVFDAKQTDIAGIAVYNKTTGREFVKLRGNISDVDLMQSEDIEVAAYIPEPLIEQISRNLSENQPLIVIITVFLNDYLFNEHDKLNSGDPYKSVFGILLPTIDEEYESSVKIFYNFTESYDTEEHCAYWHYGSTNGYENIKGQWEYQNQPLVDRNSRICNFEHTTHFALLILADVSLQEQENYAKHSSILHVITSTGCALSIVGIFSIYLTAILFTRWRQNKGNQIVLHYSTVTLLQLVLLYLSNEVRTADQSRSFCIFIGTCLHYIVLAQFCWMLIMGVLHYQRFVLVFMKPNQRVMLKACLFGYIVPIIPVIINISTLSPSNYISGNTGMCYPTGKGFTTWLLAPVLIIASVNLIFFCVIIWNVFNEKLEDMYKHDYILVLKLRLMGVLFSLLGITWLFGFAAEFLSSIVFAYFFTITGSIQGFILFLAFILLNNSTRNMYYVFLMKSYKYRKW